MANSIDNRPWIYTTIAVIIGIVLWVTMASSNSGYIHIKYRDDTVNISASNFEYLNKSDSTVGGAWYDTNEKYMIIKLNDTYYHYCNFSNDEWSGLKVSNSLYTYYQSNIKGSYDCRVYHVPAY